MALQVALDDTQTELGTAAPAAYAKIVQYTHYIVDDYVIIVVEYHYNQAAKNAGRRPLKGATYRATEAEVNAFTGNMQNRCYSWLKTLPEFAGATDV
jgi:hypothetical protein